jgi:predicted NUDIX family NTP pyrophosphohydrolase
MTSARRSAGLLMFRRAGGGLELFLVHPGGPFFRRRDAGVWSIPKGEVAPGEDPEAVAAREFAEETGWRPDACATGGERIALGAIRQRSGKVVEAWAFAGDWPAGRAVRSNTFEMEWPPGSARRTAFPEVDEGRFFPLAEAREKIHPDQVALLDRLLGRLEGGP